VKAFRGALLHIPQHPAPDGTPVAEYIPDGYLLVEQGHIAAMGPADVMAARLPEGLPVEDVTGKLILPGFIDAHVHFPQLDVVASWGSQLLDWLERYTFPAEARFDNPAHAAMVAQAFCDEMLRQGTTSALIFATVHACAAEAILAEAARRNLRIGAGKVLMDRMAPAGLCEDLETGIRQTAEQIARWHGRGRLSYAITPRFAITSTAAQLAAAGKLARDVPGLLVQTHLSENHAEIAEVARLFPDARDYLDVYERAGLVRPGAIFAHGIHLDDDARRRLADAGAAIAFCPSSNLLMGSGLFDLARTRRQGVQVALASDVAGGNSLSMLSVMAEAYKVGQLLGDPLPPATALYLATLAAARAMGIDQFVGNLMPGKEADFIIADPGATALLARRMALAPSAADKLFALMLLADDRAITQVYVMGEPVKPPSAPRPGG